MQIDYTSRDFDSIKQDIITLINARTGGNWTPTDPNDLGNILVEAFAYMGDMMSYYLDRVANETSVQTAVKTSNLLNLAALFGYKPSGPTPAVSEISFINIGSSTIDLPIGTQVMAALTYGPYREVYFETTEAVTQLPADGTTMVTVAASEGKTVNTDRPDLIDPTYHKPLPLVLGTTNGGTSQTFYIYDQNLVDGSLKVYVGQGVAFAPWTYVDSLVEWGPEDHVFTTRPNDDGTTSVIFGDSVNGMIPASNQVVSALYKTSVGSSGNLVAGAVTEVTFIPGNANVSAITSVTVTSSAAIGGADADNQSQIRSKIQAAIQTQQRAVTLQDVANLALTESLVGKAAAAAGVWSSITLYIQTQDDGTLTPGVVNGVSSGTWNDVALTVQSDLSSQMLIGTTLTVSPPSYVPIYLTVTFNYSKTYDPNAVAINIKKSLLNSGGFFSYSQNTFGRVIPLSSIISAISAVEGVTSVTVGALNTDNAGGVGTISLATGQIPYMDPSHLTVTPGSAT